MTEWLASHHDEYISNIHSSFFFISSFLTDIYLVFLAGDRVDDSDETETKTIS